MVCPKGISAAAAKELDKSTCCVIVTCSWWSWDVEADALRNDTRMHETQCRVVSISQLVDRLPTLQTPQKHTCRLVQNIPRENFIQHQRSISVREWVSDKPFFAEIREQRTIFLFIHLSISMHYIYTKISVSIHGSHFRYETRYCPKFFLEWKILCKIRQKSETSWRITNFHTIMTTEHDKRG